MSALSLSPWLSVTSPLALPLQCPACTAWALCRAWWDLGHILLLSTGNVFDWKLKGHKREHGKGGEKNSVK